MELSEAACKQGELWDRGARDWRTLMEPGAMPLWAAVLEAVRARKGTSVLDAGCGAGGAALMAAGLGAEAVGVDPSANLIAIARERLPLADFRMGEIENLPFSNAKFDAAIAINSLQWAANPQLAVHELGRVCRAGGRVGVAVFADPGRCDTDRIFRAIAQLFEKPPAGAGPFALSAPDALPSLVTAVAELRLESVDEIDCVHEFSDLDTALRGQMSAGPTWRAVEILGEARVRSAILGALTRFRHGDGTVRLVNRFRYATAVKQSTVA